MNKFFTGPTGLRTLEKEQLAYAIYKDFDPHTEIVETDKDRPARVDGIMYEVPTMTITGLVETKTRNMSAKQLEQYGSLFWKESQFKAASKACKIMQAPLYIFGVMVEDMVLFVWKAVDRNGHYLFERKTQTRRMTRNMNGGKIVTRTNLLLPFNKAERIN